MDKLQTLPSTTSNCQNLNSEEKSICATHSTLNFQLKPIKQKQLVDGIVFSLQEIYGIEKKSSDDEFASGLNEAEDKAECTTNQIEFTMSHTSSSIGTSSTATTTTLSSESSNNDSFRNDLDSDSITDKERRLEQEREQELKGIECVICMCETRDTLILPCRHLCLCKLCAMNLRVQSNNCPICRIPFIAILQLKLLRKKETLKPSAEKQDIKPAVDMDNLPIVKISLPQSNNCENLNAYLAHEDKKTAEESFNIIKSDDDNNNSILLKAENKKRNSLNDYYEPITIYEAFNETNNNLELNGDLTNTETSPANSKIKKKGKKTKKKTLEPIESKSDLIVRNVNEGESNLRK